MTNIKKIVADYETCKKAWDMGLRIESVFAYYHEDGILSGEPDLFFGNSDKTFRSKNYTEYEFYKICDAPTAEEVPLPMIFKIDNSNYCVSIDLERKCVFCNLIGFDYYEKEVIFFGGNFGSKFCCNEATARLQMAIWLCENVEEARSWYVNNNYLGDVK